jgi:DNA-binding NarL/FixJ family response regulator
MTSQAVFNAMISDNPRTDAALILWNKDVIQLMSFVLEKRDLKSKGLEPSEGSQAIEALIAYSDPACVVFDLKPPYQDSAAVALHLLERFPGCGFVITCANPELALRAAPWLSFHPIFQKPYEVDEIGDAVRSMVKERRQIVMALADSAVV